MALTNEQWDAIQTRGVDPFRAVESNEVNKHTRIVSLGRDLILTGGECDKGSWNIVNITQGQFIKDDVYISINNTIFLYFDDPLNYVVVDGNGMDYAGEYYVVLEYVYSEANPPHIAKIKIAKHFSDITDWHIILAKVTVIWNATESRYEIDTVDNSVSTPWNFENPGFSILPIYPNPTDVVQVGPGKYIKLDHSGGVLYEGGVSPAFDPVTATGQHRYDWLCIDDNKVLSIIKGIEYSNPGNPAELAPSLVASKYGLGIIHISETGAAGDEVKIEQADIVRFAEVMNSGVDISGTITWLSLLDTPNSFSGQGENVVRVKSDESGLEFISHLQAFGVINHELETNWNGTDVEWQLPYIPDHNHYIRITSDGVQMEEGQDWDWKSGALDTIVFATPPTNWTDFIEMYSGGSFTTFLDLVDTPSTYVNKGLFNVRVKSDETGLEFYEDNTTSAVEVHDPLDDSVYVSEFTYIRPTDGKRALHFPGGDSPSFAPVSSGQTRYDYLVIDDNKVLSIIQGVEQVTPTNAYDMAPDIPYDKLGIAIIRITEDTTVLINIDDIIIATESLNKGAGQYPTFLQLSDVSDSNYTGMAKDYTPLVNAAETGLELKNRKVIETAGNQTNSLRVGLDNMLKTNIYHDGTDGYINTETGDLYLDSASGDIRSHGQIYNAVYNDYADSLPLLEGQIKVPGKAYCVNSQGKAYICDRRGAINTIGICSNVYGYCCGQDGEGFVEIGVAGWVPALCDKQTYLPGTRLIANESGLLTEALTDEEKLNAIAIFMYNRGDGKSWCKVL